MTKITNILTGTGIKEWTMEPGRPSKKKPKQKQKEKKRRHNAKLVMTL